jgi:hypothetical protein
MLAAMLAEGYSVSFALDHTTGRAVSAGLTGPLGSQATGIGDSPAAALASVWPLGHIVLRKDLRTDVRDVSLARVGGSADAGPFETEQQARETPAVRAMYAAFDRAPSAGKMAPHIHRVLCEAVTEAGVELGAFDHRILLWLAGWEPQTAVVLAGIITRAGTAGNADLTARLVSLRDHLAGVLDDGGRDLQYALERAERELTAICQDTRPATGEAAGE